MKANPSRRPLPGLADQGQAVRLQDQKSRFVILRNPGFWITLQYMIHLNPIGIIRTPYREKEGMPIQPAGAKGTRGQVIMDREYTRGLKDLENFSHLILIYFFHECEGYDLEVIPFLDSAKRGLFATRAPRRPNAVGLSVVRLLEIRENVLEIENVDMLDGTPLLDIKPYIGDFDQIGDYRGGWTEQAGPGVRKARSDRRFS